MSRGDARPLLYGVKRDLLTCENTKVWVKREGRWQLVSAQVTPIQP